MNLPKSKRKRIKVVLDFLSLLKDPLFFLSIPLSYSHPLLTTKGEKIGETFVSGILFLDQKFVWQVLSRSATNHSKKNFLWQFLSFSNIFESIFALALSVIFKTSIVFLEKGRSGSRLNRRRNKHKNLLKLHISEWIRVCFAQSKASTTSTFLHFFNK